ncbi:MAG: pirin family protein, partial [Gammaproteobacteria bacterium]|nr:pirin family protein [Gammaproteobacteria bacterium]
ETVTIVYHGEVAHRDSTGSGGVIGPGDVQWMTAASGILHEEFHSLEFSKSGGLLEMVQLWVNLPARDKMSPPAYQTLLNEEIPVVSLPDEAGRLRVIAGEFHQANGPAKTFSPMDVWDLRLRQGKNLSFDYPADRTLALIVLQGSVQCNQERASQAELLILDRQAGHVSIDADTDAIILVLGGEPINEPVAGHGPFVMNTRAEILQAFEDFNSGNFGRL